MCQETLRLFNVHLSSNLWFHKIMSIHLEHLADAFIQSDFIHTIAQRCRNAVSPMSMYGYTEWLDRFYGLIEILTWWGHYMAVMACRTIFQASTNTLSTHTALLLWWTLWTLKYTIKFLRKFWFTDQVEGANINLWTLTLHTANQLAGNQIWDQKMPARHTQNKWYLMVNHYRDISKVLAKKSLFSVD